jgi:opacity protein-like surface antigen
MKTIACLLLAAAIMASAVSGLFAAEWSFGLKGGLDLAKLSGDIEDFGWKMGASGGAFFRWPIGSIFAVQPEVLIAMKGAKETGELLDIPFERFVKLTYLEIPLLVKACMPARGNIRPNLYAGPAVGFKLGARIRVEAMGYAIEDDVEDVRSTDFGFIGGAGLDYRLNSHYLLVDVRYEAGLATIDDSSEKRDVSNNAITFMAGFGFAF